MRGKLQKKPVMYNYIMYNYIVSCLLLLTVLWISVTFAARISLARATSVRISQINRKIHLNITFILIRLNSYNHLFHTTLSEANSAQGILHSVLVDSTRLISNYYAHRQRCVIS